jgi:spore maturation protein CgeB
VGAFAQEHARGIVAFYDIDTPVTLGKLARGDHDYIAPALIPRYDLYLSFTGGPVLETLERMHGSPMARRLYCSVDPAAYPVNDAMKVWDLSYLGTYSPDRQPTLEALLIEPARQAPNLRFAVAGPQYPADIAWPANVERIDHVPPADHPGFYAKSRYTLNVTRGDMIAAGHSPSVRLFEAAATGTPIISDRWEGLDTIFAIGGEIVTAATSADVLSILTTTTEPERERLARAGRDAVLGSHTAAHRAHELEGYLRDAIDRAAGSSRANPMSRSRTRRSVMAIDDRGARRMEP